MQNLWNPPTQAEENASVIGNFPTRTAFFASILGSAKTKYLRENPGTVVRNRIVNLAGGRVLEVIVRLSVKLDGRRVFLSIENYNLFHNGVGYDVEYQGPPPKDGIDIPVSQRSARTIHFVTADRNR